VSEEKPEIKVQIDLSLLKFDDWEIIFSMQDGKQPQGMFELLKRCVVGGTDNLPFTAFMGVMRLFNDEIAKMMNPVDASGKA
jgi:hypothetical protein